MASYPVVFDLDRPEQMSRAHLFLRLLILVLLSWITGSSGVIGLVYFGVPVVAAVLIAQTDGEHYLAEDGERVTRWIRFAVGTLAYLALLTDELPGAGRHPVRLEIARSGSPSVASALVRILKAIPNALVVALLGVVAWLVWVIAACCVLFNEHYPEALWNFQRGVVRWQARLLAYLASLVDPYPPYSLDTGSEGSLGQKER